MNEWLKNVLERVKNAWGKWSLVQKIIFISIVMVLVGSLVFLASLSGAPSMVPLLNKAITDPQVLEDITTRLEEENVPYQVTADNRILVSDEKTARRMRAILVREDLVPRGTDPWELFDIERWTITDFERNVNLRRAITRTVEEHLKALDDIDDASVTLVLPEKALFAEDQEPPSASIIIVPKPGSDITSNRKKIEGIVKLVQFAVEGLDPENITITDQRGVVLNDFEGMEQFDRLELARRQLKTKQELENEYKKRILSALATVFRPDRVEIVNLDIELDMSDVEVKTEEHFPITMKPDNPRTPYDESEVVPSITLSKEIQDEKFEGTGFNPEGPPGQEGQTPPAYKDLEGLVGKYSRNSVIQNEVVNTRNITERKDPWEIKRISVAVALDGVWKWEYNEKGEVVFNPDGSIKRTYLPVSDEDIRKAEELIKAAVGYKRERGDLITVQHIQFDRTLQFAEEDAAFRARRQLERTVFYSLLGVAALLVAFIIFRLIAREMERRRRLKEEELARQHQAMREAALRSAEEEAAAVEMSVEERARMELQEQAINMAREHPEEVAQLIRTWLMEE
ncbi:flagellar basal-body MS-ring/collar protein FliF [Spirochaeta thermophila]|uniref:Flagellar M-ring protein n=1 Tax=Winmispira thermophila (strain ATCC 49972 / DSM 6192 / RI 19.B1) TaxID=665571 RepID=E0RS70_WINT6|nr:flagellar basal-body MS-ring/collar protein FliF [Spirochaeta thermophila]ADN01857.1 flagellar M-ring protein [Spirochaeta thermophila DSM 6192]